MPRPATYAPRLPWQDGVSQTPRSMQPRRSASASVDGTNGPPKRRTGGKHRRTAADASPSAAGAHTRQPASAACPHPAAPPVTRATHPLARPSAFASQPALRPLRAKQLASSLPKVFEGFQGTFFKKFPERGPGRCPGTPPAAASRFSASCHAACSPRAYPPPPIRPLSSLHLSCALCAQINLLLPSEQFLRVFRELFSKSYLNGVRGGAPSASPPPRSKRWEVPCSPRHSRSGNRVTAVFS